MSCLVRLCEPGEPGPCSLGPGGGAPGTATRRTAPMEPPALEPPARRLPHIPPDPVPQRQRRRRGIPIHPQAKRLRRAQAKDGAWGSQPQQALPTVPGDVEQGRRLPTVPGDDAAWEPGRGVPHVARGDHTDGKGCLSEALQEVLANMRQALAAAVDLEKAKTKITSTA